MNKRNRLTPEVRYEELLEIAVRLASFRSYTKVGAKEIAKAAQCSRALVAHYLGTTEEIRRVVMEVGVKRGILRIVAYGLIHNHEVALKAPKQLRITAFKFVSDGKL